MTGKQVANEVQRLRNKQAQAQNVRKVDSQPLEQINRLGEMPWCIHRFQAALT